MKSRWNIVVLALLAIIGVLTWTIVRDHNRALAPVAAVGPVQTAPNMLTIRVEAAPPSPAAAPTTSPVIAAARHAGPASEPSAAQPPMRPGTPINAIPVVHDSGGAGYTAQPGDTVSNLAAALPGGNKKINRDAVINANPSLQRDPDLVIAGKTYQIPAPGSVAPAAVSTSGAVHSPAPATAEARAVPAAAVVIPAVVAASPEEVVHELRYLARAGDTVRMLAATLLGSDSKENRDAIIGANASLQADPDRLIAGQTYRIPVRASQPLASAPASELHVSPRPTTQPDADSVVRVGSPRELRYTAQPGDSVSTLATALLGSDTKENRDAIIDNNRSLKQDPDHVVAGKSYWIPAPMPQQP